MNSIRNPRVRDRSLGPLAKIDFMRQLQKVAATAAGDVVDLAMIIRFALFSEEKVGRRLNEVIHLPPRPVGEPKPKVRMTRRFIVFLALVSVSRVAVAQEADVQTPIDLFEEAAGPGVRVGPGLVLNGVAEAELVHDTNIYSRVTPEISDTLAIFRPSLSLRTDYDRHLAVLTTGAEIRRYFDTSDENSEQFWVTGRSRLDLGERLTFSSRAEFAQRIERRGTAGDAFLTDAPVEFIAKRADFEIARRGGTLELIGGIGLSRRDYDDASLNGVPIDLSYRDVMIESARLRSNYRVSENLQLFGQASVNRVNYDNDAPVSRDSDGFGLLAGVKFKPSNLTDVEVGAGYIRQSYDSAAVSSTSGINYYVNANWTPTPQWRISASGGRTIDPSPLLDVPAVVRSDFDLRVQRALGDRLLVEAGAEYVNEDFEGLARNDDRYSLRLGVRARITERLGASAFAGYRKRSSNLDDRTYDGASFGVNVRFLL